MSGASACSSSYVRSGGLLYVSSFDRRIITPSDEATPLNVAAATFAQTGNILRECVENYRNSAPTQADTDDGPLSQDSAHCSSGGAWQLATDASARLGLPELPELPPGSLQAGAIAACSTIVCGGIGGTTGLIAGGALGAAAGVPAAFFTFGLSIPFCVVMGGSGGAAVGSVVGSTVGFMGAAGGMYARRGSLKLGEKNMEPILKEPSERPLVSGTGSSE